ncbi:purine-binding chemotaxis protein CheW [Pseudomonas duriflava]|uniref:Purine-binding chemotaxis protein CheW n=1 Tax=Pseudomonas duriflava TaxID=459528 RepID=A0A562QFP7_9PSED|nr:chemotaxis protein CheW [Pseudomonas duriflava]TWI54856.1 purine-binding chemotaxis protein CheW [Pseudomonas duriflava]
MSVHSANRVTVAAQPPRQYLTFSLNNEMFAVSTTCVREIIEYGPVTTMPMMPRSIRGVINLRGAAVPVLDLGVRFSGVPTEASRRSCIVMLELSVEGRQQVFGIIVDAVNEVLEIAQEAIEPTPRFGTHIRTDFILGMAKRDNGFVILLNIDQVLNAEDVRYLATQA